MSYTLVNSPFSLDFQAMTKKELREYFAWFNGISPQRLRELTDVVRQTPGFETWEGDCTPASLDRLGEWFANVLETRSRTSEEMHEIAAHSAIPIEVQNEELSNRTISFAVDVGMYLSQVLIKNHPGLQWAQQFGNRRNVDYGQPVLVGFGTLPFNPVRMTITLAYGIVSNKKTGTSLRELYDVWKNLIVVVR